MIVLSKVTNFYLIFRIFSSLLKTKLFNFQIRILQTLHIVEWDSGYQSPLTILFSTDLRV